MAKAAQHAQVDALPGERNLQRIIVRMTSVSRMSIAQRIKKTRVYASAGTVLPS